MVNPAFNRDNQKELEKLDLTIYQRKMHQLKIQQYQIFLDIDDMAFDPISSTIVVKVTEGSDVIYEITTPVATKTRDIQHSIGLQKINGNWQISYDKYEDDFWRMYKNSKLTNSELRNRIDTSAKQLALSMSYSTNIIQEPEREPDPCLVRDVNVCYDRAGVKAYANAHYSFATRNTDYVWFAGLDCTNYASQAMYLGGGVSEYIPQEALQQTTDTAELPGWYYFFNPIYNNIHRSPSLAGVDQFHEFLVPGPTAPRFVYLGGPIARELQPNELGDLQIGDFIQFDWTCLDLNGCGFDHSVIVVDIQYTFGQRLIYVDSHTDDAQHKLLSEYSPWNQIRYIHINDHLQRVTYLSTIQNSTNSYSGSQEGSQAYPAPTSSKQSITLPQAYPAP